MQWYGIMEGECGFGVNISRDNVSRAQVSLGWLVIMFGSTEKVVSWKD